MSLLWHAATSLAAPLIPWWLRRRARSGKEDPTRLEERLGRGADRPEGQLVWLHGASVGESLSLIPLIEALAERLPDAHFLLTTGTVTSARLAMEQLPPALRGRVRHRYAPLDTLTYVARFLAGWNPSAAVFAESEFWPNRLLATRHVRVPMALVNGRMSQRSFERWQRWAPGLARRMLKSFTLIQPQTSADEIRLRGLGALGMWPSGDLKLSAPPLPHDPAALAAERHDGPVFLAAATHPGEEAIVAAAHGLLRDRHPGLRTIIVPRHADRGAELAAALGATRRALGEPPGELHIADTMGELGLFYRLADVALVGGSLVPHGGHNPMEPARLGCPILIGPYTHNFAERVADLLEEGGARVVAPPDATALAAAVHDVLINAEKAGAMTRAARLLAERTTGTAARLADEIAEWLRPAPTDGVLAPDMKREHHQP